MRSRPHSGYICDSHHRENYLLALSPYRLTLGVCRLGHEGFVVERVVAGSADPGGGRTDAGSVVLLR